MVSLGRFRLAPLLQPFVELLAADLHVTNETGNRLRPEGLGWMAVSSDLGSLPIRDPKLAGIFALKICTKRLEEVDEVSVLKLGKGTQTGMSSTVTCRLWAERASSRRSGYFLSS